MPNFTESSEEFFARGGAPSTTIEGAQVFDSESDARLALFYRQLKTGPWIQPGPRVAIADGQQITSPGIDQPLPNSTFPFRPLKLYPVSADSQAELLTSVAALANNTPVQAFQEWSPARHSAVILAKNPEELAREIAQAQIGIPRAFESGGEWKTPGGSYFTATPLGADGVAFLYPGIGSPYPGLGADLFSLSPPLQDRFEAMTRGEAHHYLHVDEMYPATPGNEAAFYRDVVMLGHCAIATSLIYTWILRELFGVKPRAACGYSFGEAIMLACLGVWPDPLELAKNLDRIPTFSTRLHGPKDSIREQWGLPPGTKVEWDSWTVRTTPAIAFAAIKPEKNVFLCNINTPGEVVIAGDRNGCNRALERIGASVASPVPIPVTMHCEATRGEYDNLVAIHDLTVIPQPGIDFFSSAYCRPIDFAKESPAHTTAEAYCRVADFPRLVRNIYATGPKIFLELGGRRNCCTWIEKILKDRPHSAIPCDLKGQPSEVSILRALARLVSNGVPVDLRALYSVVESR